MRKKAIILALSMAVSFGSMSWAAVPEKSQGAVQYESAAGLPGSLAELETALNEPSMVTYKVLVIDENPADRTAYLDEVLARWGWPAANEMYLVVYPKATYDIRFALGASFKLSDVPVEEVLGLVRSEYLPRSQKGDAAGGLAALIRTVNRRMAPAGVNASQANFDAMAQTVRLLERQEAEGLLAMIQPNGLFAVPYAVGLPETGGLTPEKARKVLTALVHEARPVIAGYNLTGAGHIQVVVKGLRAGLEVPASGTAESTITTTDLAQLTLHKVGSEWKLAVLSFDVTGVLAQRLEKGEGYQKPFAWVDVKLNAEQFTVGWGSEPDGQWNTTEQKHITSLISTELNFHASYSPNGKHTGTVHLDPNWTYQAEQRTINGRPVLIMAVDQKQEGGWKNRYLWIEDGNWMYHLQDGLGNLERLLDLAASIPQAAPVVPNQATDWAKLSEAEQLKIARDLMTNMLSTYKADSIPEIARLKAFRIDELKVQQSIGDGSPVVMVTYSLLPVNPGNTTWFAGNGLAGEGGWIVGKEGFMKVEWGTGGWEIKSLPTSP